VQAITFMRAASHGYELPPTSVHVHAAHVVITGDITVPPDARGMIVFADGSGAGRRDAANRYLAASFVGAGFATLVLDLLSPEEAATPVPFDSEPRAHLLGDRLTDAIAWIGMQDELDYLPIGLFGSTSGTAAAVIAASSSPAVGAIVSRSGRADLAGELLDRLRCPTLLIVGAKDAEVIEINRRVLARLGANAAIHIVSHAGHRFDEVGAIRELADVSALWFTKHLVRAYRQLQRDELPIA
jgi:pimeloyl-ACP methyl ester carboxylesterase